MADKLLAEWFWTDRWMGSSAFLLPLEARGLYREMLTQAWRRGGSLPKEPASIQRACGITADEWTRCWPLVKDYWVENGTSIYNATQREILAESDRRHIEAVGLGKLRAEKGTRGLDGRFLSTAGSTAGPCNGPPLDQPPSPSPSPTPEPSPSTRSSAGADARVVQRLWNENRGPLPACESINPARERRLRALHAEAKGDEILLAAAIAAFAKDRFILERRYGIDTLTRAEHRAKWLDKGRNGHAKSALDILLPDNDPAFNGRD